MTLSTTALAWVTQPDRTVVEFHLRLVVPMIPAVVGFLILSFAAGAHARSRATWSSPSWAWIGRRLAMGGASLLVVFVTAPLVWSEWIPHAGTLTAGVGLATWIANLPKRL